MHRLDGPDTLCRVMAAPAGKSYPFYVELQHSSGSTTQLRAQSQQQLQAFMDAAVGTFAHVVVETEEVEPPSHHNEPPPATEQPAIEHTPHITSDASFEALLPPAPVRAASPQSHGFGDSLPTQPAPAPAQNGMPAARESQQKGDIVTQSAHLLRFPALVPWQLAAAQLSGAEERPRSQLLPGGQSI